MVVAMVVEDVVIVVFLVEEFSLDVEDDATYGTNCFFFSVVVSKSVVWSVVEVSFSGFRTVSSVAVVVVGDDFGVSWMVPTSVFMLASVAFDSETFSVVGDMFDSDMVVRGALDILASVAIASENLVFSVVDDISDSDMVV